MNQEKKNELTNEDIVRQIFIRCRNTPATTEEEKEIIDLFLNDLDKLSTVINLMVMLLIFAPGFNEFFQSKLDRASGWQSFNEQSVH